jgi:hypothetical protein
VAAGQHGVVTQAQLIAAGLDRDAIAYRRRVGRLHLLQRGVYAVGHRSPSPLATAISAVLACGPDAVLSHRSAAALWRIVPRWHTPTEVTAPTQHRLEEILVHRSRHQDTTVHYGMRVTTPARTLVGLAGVLPPKRLTRALTRPGSNGSSPPPSWPSSSPDIQGGAQPTSRSGATPPTAGFATLRVTDRRLEHHPTKEAQRLEAVLRSRFRQIPRGYCAQTGHGEPPACA